jgi:acid stress-induced BolA-like protein IbaG/YrbA
MITVKHIKDLVEQALPGALVQVEDATGAGDHFNVVVVTSQFDGKTLVEQHQLVYAPLRRDLGGNIHALALRTYTPEQWARQGGSA